MKKKSTQFILRYSSIIVILVAIWYAFQEEYEEAILAFVTGVGIYMASAGESKPSTVSEKEEQRNRTAMIKSVHSTWISGLLKKSLYGKVMIELGMETNLEAVDFPAKMQLEGFDKQPKTLPSDKNILEVFEEANENLLILGAPGAGKTTVMLDLAKQLLDRADNDPRQLIPVIFNLSSWQEKQTLEEWMVGQLRTNYYVSQKQAQEWVGARELLPLLDGLDEVGEDRREPCAEAINTYRQEHGLGGIVVCSRDKEYQRLQNKLILNQAVSLYPLEREQIHQYLDKISSSTNALQAVLDSDPKLFKLAQTPLMLNIMLMAYHGLSKQELADLTKGSGDHTQRLFAFYVERMLARPRSGKKKWSPKNTMAWLGWLARGMQFHNQKLFLVEKLQPIWLLEVSEIKHSRLAISVGLGLGGGLSGGLDDKQYIRLAKNLNWTWINFGRNLVFVLGAFLVEKTDIQIVESLNWSWKNIGRNLGIGLIGGLVGFGLLFGLLGNLIGGLVYGLFIGLFYGLFGGLVNKPVEESVFPNQGIRLSLRNGLFYGLVYGLVYGLGAGLLSGLVYGLAVGLTVGCGVSLNFGLLAGIQHFLLRWLLTERGAIPYHYVDFLEYSVDRILLQRVGGGYIFIHRMLLEWFADLDLETYSPPEIPVTVIENLEENPKESTGNKAIQIFISYSRKDTATTDRLVKALENKGYDVWLDRQDIQGGRQWKGEIAEAIEESDWFLLLFSPNSAKSNYVLKELDVAEGEKIPVLPVALKKTKISTEMKLQLAGKQEVRLYPDFEKGIKKLFSALEKK